MRTLELRCGPTICEVAPEIGGAILSLTVGRIPVLRQTPQGSSNVLDTACFPLVPFANRIDGGRFVFLDREIVLLEDPAAPPHAHHGQGWRRRWNVDQLGDDCAELSLLHERDDWPWRYRATQTMTSTANGLTVAITLHNLDDSPMPAGLGFHPFFPREPNTRIALDSSERLLNDERGIPETSVAFDPGIHTVAALDGTDNLLLGGGGVIDIAGAAGTTRIVAQGAIGFHLYVPSGQTFLCAEPVTHQPNSFARQHPDEVLAPSASATMRMTIIYTAHG